ncbi:hypothetical protein [Sphingomonas sp.]|jgi:hypothetical protein|uniref:hypothetical protein n=1 Tax=Sphingomonas sp. TaxID=28214 RepID=UPI002E373977|nr:hypothetical protein [Sphingomonas sp.]HEX4694822.1 hypothetical protein [Sphingomonas sp.]
MRPRSIRQFEYCYLGSLLLGAAVTAITWNANASSTEVKQIEAVFGASFLPIFYVFVYALSLALWYFTARVPNLAAKWIVVGWFALSLLGVLLSLGTGHIPNDLPSLLSIVAIVLNAVAVWLLFRPDARAWFGETA